MNPLESLRQNLYSWRMHSTMFCRTLLFGGLLCLFVSAQAAESDSNGWRHEEIHRFKAAEANQGVAVDEKYFYAINNHDIGKYRKDTGERVGGWKGPKGGALTHLNAGIVRDGKLYGAHSNFPGIPIVSSVEIWDTATMKHVGTHSFGIDSGSLTWVDYRDGHWFACFAHYAKEKTQTGRDPAWTELVQFDDQWRRMGGWVFPPGLIARFGEESSSGGGFGPSGSLFTTGHDAKELYVLEFPEAGSVLNWIATIPISAEGQAFCWDQSNPGMFYSISRKNREVIVSKITR